jgi:hypothetical protein
MSYSETEIANDVLEFLSETPYKAFQTAKLVGELTRKTGKDYNDEYIQVREVLRRLHGYNRLFKTVVSKAKHTWRIKCEDWDRNNPFTFWAGGSEDEPNPTPPDDTTEEPAPLPRVSAPSNDGAIRELREKIKSCEADIVTQNAEIKMLREALSDAKRSAPVIHVNVGDDKPTKLKNKVLPKIYEHVLQLCSARRNVLLIGPAGSGKTYLGELISESLKLSFFPMSFNEEVGKAELIGTRTPNMTKGTNEFQASPFLEAFETGGVALLDELDAANPNALLALNSALANGYVSVPLRKGNTKAVMHKDFVCIATANTYGTGANRQYVGRNQLDEASLDRFRIGTVECDYDPIVEESLCPYEELRNALQRVRRNLNDNGIRRIVSTRFMKDAYIMHKVAKWDTAKVLNTLFQGWRDEEVMRAKEGVAL